MIILFCVSQKLTLIGPIPIDLDTLGVIFCIFFETWDSKINGRQTLCFINIPSIANICNPGKL